MELRAVEPVAIVGCGVVHIGELAESHELATATLEGTVAYALNLGGEGYMVDICASREGEATNPCDARGECYATKGAPIAEGVVGDGPNYIVEDDTAHTRLPVVEHKGGSIPLGDIAHNGAVVSRGILYLVGGGHAGVLNDAELVECGSIVAHVVEHDVGNTCLVGVVGCGGEA